MAKEDLCPLWTQEEPSICKFCAFANINEGIDSIYCEKKHKFTEEDFSCKKFKYDILKRNLKRRAPLKKKYTKEQFEL